MNPFKKQKPKVVSSQEPRTPQEIQQEYLQLASKLGELEFNYRTIPGQQNDIIARIKELDAEMGRSRAKAQEQVNKAKVATDKVKAEQAKASNDTSNEQEPVSGAV